MNLGIQTVEAVDKFCTAGHFCVNLPNRLSECLGALSVAEKKELFVLVGLKERGSSLWYQGAVDWYDKLPDLTKGMFSEAYADGILRSSATLQDGTVETLLGIQGSDILTQQRILDFESGSGLEVGGESGGLIIGPDTGPDTVAGIPGIEGLPTEIPDPDSLIEIGIDLLLSISS